MAIDPEHIDRRFDELRDEIGDVVTRVDTHERALFGGQNPITGERHVGLIEQLQDAIGEIKKIGSILERAANFAAHAGQSILKWGGRLLIAGIIALGGFAWFVVTHWERITKAFAQ